MNDILLLSIIVCLSFGIESIFGLGGITIALTLSAFFFDIKEVIILLSFAGLVSGFLIFLSDRKSFNVKMFLQILLFAVPGIFLGAFLLRNFSSPFLLKIFGVFLITYAIWALWFANFYVKKIFRKIINFLGGTITGLFGTGGAFFVVAMRNAFRHKSEMRTTFAVLFFTLGVLRVLVYFQNGILDFGMMKPYWWIVFPMIGTMLIGYHIHLKISEKTFQKGVSVLLGLAGISFLFS